MKTSFCLFQQTTNILNSKSEFNRCHIPRLIVEQEEEGAKERSGLNSIMEGFNSLPKDEGNLTGKIYC